MISIIGAAVILGFCTWIGSQAEPGTEIVGSVFAVLGIVGAISWIWFCAENVVTIRDFIGFV